MTGRIFHLNEQGEATPMEEQPYDAEKVLQQLLAEHPDLLAGDQMESSDPRRWLLIRREMGIPSKEEGSGRWSVDHLFLDQDAVPTLVEVKRSTDTRLRREVVGQMLDYRQCRRLLAGGADPSRVRGDHRCPRGRTIQFPR